MKAVTDGVIRVITGCENCDWESDYDGCYDVGNARKTAMAHAEIMGHETWVEIGKVVRYKGKKSNPRRPR